MYLCWFQKLDKAPRKEGFILKFLFFQSSLYPGLAYSEEYRGKCSFGTYPNLDGPGLRAHLVEPPGFPCAGRDEVRKGFNRIYLWAPILLIFINSWKATSENINEDMSHVSPHINKTSLVLNSYYSRATKGKDLPHEEALPRSFFPEAVSWAYSCSHTAGKHLELCIFKEKLVSEKVYNDLAYIQVQPRKTSSLGHKEQRPKIQVILKLMMYFMVT